MSRSKLEGIGYACLGVGFLYQSAKAFGLFGLGAPDLGRSVGRLAGPEGRALAKAAANGGVIERVETHQVDTIEERVAHIQKRIREDSAKPKIRELALGVLTRKCEDRSGRVVWCYDEKDSEAEIVALFEAVRDPESPMALRYTRDHYDIDQFHSADKLLKLKAGDCDDGCILLGSLLRSVGFPVRLRVIQDNRSSTFSHIYLLVGIPPSSPTKWVPLDWSMPDKPPGWEAPGAAAVSRTGRPSGVVTRLADFAV